MRIPWLALVLPLPVAASCSSSSSAPPPPDHRFDALGSAIEADLAASAATGASVSVWLDDEIVWVGGFGTADPAGGAAPDEDTRFQIGSDTKKLTALSLLREVAAGKLTLDMTVGDVLPDLHMMKAPAFTSTTLRQLLSHQSGIVDSVELTSSTTDADLAGYAYGDFATGYASLVEPGLFYNYANPNFAIAGLIDEHLDGRPWGDVVEADLFAPLEMTRTVARKSELDDDTAVGNGIAIDSTDGANKRISIDDTWESAFVRPAGLVWSTPSDQIRLARFLVDGDDAVLDSSLRAEVTSPQTMVNPDLTAAYGFGMFMDRGIPLADGYRDVPFWAHGGVTLSYSSTFFVLPEQRFAISILSNGRGDNFSASVLTAIETLVQLPAATTRPTPPFDATKLDDLAGTYEAFDPDIGPFEIAVTRTNDTLEIAVPILDANNVPYDHALTAESTHVWIGRLGGEIEELAFIETPGGTYLRNRAFVGRRATAP